MDPQQELFTELLVRIKAKGYDVYDGKLPPEGAPYPFVYLGDFRESDDETKTSVVGTVYPVIHVWHNNPKQRGTASAIIADVKQIFRSIVKTSNYSWFVRNINQRVFADDTTKTILLHGVIEAEFKFS